MHIIVSGGSIPGQVHGLTGSQDAQKRLDEARPEIAAARAAGVDVRQAERLLGQAELAYQVGNLKAAAELAAMARRSVRHWTQRAAYVELAFRKLEGDLKALKERGVDTSEMETKLAEARAVRAKDPELSRKLFAGVARSVGAARGKLADKRKRAILGDLPK